MIDLTNKKILVVVAHPDDEVLGLGATMYDLISNKNCEVRVVILGEGITSRSLDYNVELWSNELSEHRKNIKTACNKIGYQSYSHYNFPDNRFDSVDLLDIIKIIEREKEEFKPYAVFTHHGGDVNIDHQRTFEAVITSCRPQPGEVVKVIVTFETLSGTEWRASSDPKYFNPNWFSRIDQQSLQVKIDAMESYTFERRPYPHPRSPEGIEIRAKMWGLANGFELAEAFQIIRLIT